MIASTFQRSAARQLFKEQHSIQVDEIFSVLHFINGKYNINRTVTDKEGRFVFSIESAYQC